MLNCWISSSEAFCMEMNACLIYVGLGCLFDGYLRFARFTFKNLSSLWSSYFSNAAQTKHPCTTFFILIYLSMSDWIWWYLQEVSMLWNLKKSLLFQHSFVKSLLQTHISEMSMCFLRFNANYCYNEYEIMTRPKDSAKENKIRHERKINLPRGQTLKLFTLFSPLNS